MAAIAGGALALVGRPLAGGAIALLGLLDLGTTWWFRYLPPPDPVLAVAIKEATKLRRTDPAAADQMLSRAFTEAEDREKQELAQLHAKAALDRRAALQLRDRLRSKMKIHEGARRRAERNLANSPTAAAVLQEIDRMTTVTQQQLAEAELIVEQVPTSS